MAPDNTAHRIPLDRIGATAPGDETEGKRHWDGPREVAGSLGKGAVVLRPRKESEAPGNAGEDHERGAGRIRSGEAGKHQIDQPREGDGQPHPLDRSRDRSPGRGPPPPWLPAPPRRAGGAPVPALECK